MRKNLTYKLICLALCMCMLTAGMITATAEITELPVEQINAMNREFTMLDITKAVNRGFSDDVSGDGLGGWTDQGSSNDFSSFDLRGVNRLCGVNFNIIEPKDNDGKSAIVLRGQNWAFLPTSVQIPVNKKGAVVYFLHAMAWSAEVVAEYTFNYADGSSQSVSIRGTGANADIFDWWVPGNSPTARTAWLGSNESSGSIGLSAFACENPKPDLEIESITLSTPGDGAIVMVVAATLCNEAYLPTVVDDSNPDTSRWFPYIYPDYRNMKGTAMDASFLLDAPAGKHGYLNAVGDDFIFDDGTVAKFWGVNVFSQYNAAITYSIPNSYQDAIESADALACMGFNLVRFHALFGRFNLFDDGKGGKMQGDTQTFNDRKLDLLFYYINELKQRGIYTMIDISCADVVLENDNIRNTAGQVAQATTVYAEPRYKEIIKNNIKRLFTTKNPYTDTTLAEDPAIVFIDLVNERSLLGTSQNKSLSAAESAILQEKFNKWLLDRYKTRNAIAEAWGEVNGLSESEDPVAGTVLIEGNDKRALYSEQRQTDSNEFLSLVMREFHNELYEYMRSLGIKALITGNTVWDKNQRAVLSSNLDMDYIDYHNYKSHPSTGTKVTNAKTVTSSTMLKSAPSLAYVGNMLGRLTRGLPYTVSEWNDVFPSYTMSESMLIVPAMSAFQDFHPMLYSWCEVNQGELRAKRPPGQYDVGYRSFLNIFNIAEQPHMMACFPSAAMLRLRDVTEADKGFYTRWRDKQFFTPTNQTISADISIGLIGKMGMAFDEIAYNPDDNDNDVLYLAQKAKNNGEHFVSVTGEMVTDYNTHTFKVNTKNTQAVTGAISNTQIELDDVIFDIDNEFATMFVSSVTDKPIWQSDRLLLTAVGQMSRNTNMVLEDRGLKIKKIGQAPILVEPIAGEVILKTHDDIAVYALDSSGQRTMMLPVYTEENGHKKIIISAEYRASNYEIVRLSVSDKSGENEHISFGDTSVPQLFTDLGGYDDISDKIDRIVLQELMDEVSEGKFSPEGNVTRREFVYGLMRGLGLSKASDTDFADVDKKDEAYAEISTARTLGIVNGDSDGLFKPDDFITVEQMLTIAAKAIPFSFEPVTVNDIEFADIADGSEISGYAQQHASDMLSWNYINLKDGRLNPGDFATRAQMAELIYNILWQ